VSFFKKQKVFSWCRGTLHFLSIFYPAIVWIGKTQLGFAASTLRPWPAINNQFKSHALQLKTISIVAAAFTLSAAAFPSRFFRRLVLLIYVPTGLCAFHFSCASAV